MRYALKEWPAGIKALETGAMIVLFRKGGIHEKTSSFRLPAPQAILFPSFEHQKLSMLKSQPSSGAKISPYIPGDKIKIHHWVEFRDLFEIKDHILTTDLSSFHIWTDEFLNQRRAWKPERPLLVLTCFTYQFVKPVEIEYKKEYAGCKSWIELETEISRPKSIAIHTEDNFSQKVASLRLTLH